MPLAVPANRHERLGSGRPLHHLQGEHIDQPLNSAVTTGLGFDLGRVVCHGVEQETVPLW
jgi:hypothetical protein